MFRFTIRDVLWLTVLVALAVGWWIDHTYRHDDEATLWYWRALEISQEFQDKTGESTTWSDSELEIRDKDGKVIKTIPSPGPNRDSR